MKKVFLLLTLFSSLSFVAQNSITPKEDTKYFEDQLYLGIQYNGKLNRPDGFETTGVPYSVNGGFIKDIPINKHRNKGFGIGVGYSYDELYPNILISPGQTNTFSISNNDNKNKYKIHSIEFPIEYRWRTSTTSSYTFWRIYSGISFINSYQFSSEYVNDNNEAISTKNIPEIRKTNIALYSSMGYGTWNFHVKYFLMPLFKDSAKANNTPLDFQLIKLGIQFYIL